MSICWKKRFAVILHKGIRESSNTTSIFLVDSIIPMMMNWRIVVKKIVYVDEKVTFIIRNRMTMKLDQWLASRRPITNPLRIFECQRSVKKIPLWLGVHQEQVDTWNEFLWPMICMAMADIWHRLSLSAYHTMSGAQTVILDTSVGSIEIELYTRHAPKYVKDTPTPLTWSLTWLLQDVQKLLRACE